MSFEELVTEMLESELDALEVIEKYQKKGVTKNE